jgi:hypothetical protein
VTEQEQELQRVELRIAEVILFFCKWKKMHGFPEFHMAQLQTYVNMYAPSAPGSPDRVLRDLRKQGKVSYEVVSRSASLYRLL